MALFGRSKTATGAGVIATLILVLAFGNQAFTEWVTRHTHANTVWGWFMRQLSWPAWTFGPSDNSSAAMRNMVAEDLRALFLLVFVAAVLGLAAKALVGGAGGFILGWAALIFASALAAFITAFIAAHSTWLGAFNAASAGSAYGLFVGWIVGIATGGGKAASS